LQAGLCKGEDVFWGWEKERSKEEGDADDGENEEDSIHWWGYGLDGQPMSDCAGANRAVVGDGFWEQDGAEEDEERPDAIDY
jgi:hypothetical protein